MIKLRQHINGNFDPVLDITITNHPSYLKEGKTVSTVEEALRLVEKWLSKTSTGTQSNIDSQKPSEEK